MLVQDGPSSVSVLRDCEVNTVVHATVLGDRGEHRLVVRRGVDRKEAVGTRGETLCDVSGNNTVAIGGGVDALEESELGHIGGLGLVE